MPDTFTKITRTGYGSRVGKSFGGVLVGLILFVASFAVLYWNEGRQDMSEIAKTATEIEADVLNQNDALEDSLISVTGLLTTEETLGDDYLVAGEYIALKRTAEMYAWVEETEEESETETGGSEVTKTTYEYKKDWSESPQDSSDFEYQEDHYNPTKKIENKSQTVNNADVGVYNIDADSIEMPNYSSIEINDENAILDQTDAVVKSNYLFIGEGTLENPEVGDIRISYSAVMSDINVTAFGKLGGDEISAYLDKDNNKLYRLFAGSRDEAISTMHTEYVTMLWVLRVVGFVMMWIGLGSLFAPLTTIADVLPILGKVGRGILSVVTFIVALVLSIITILVSMILHNIIAVVIIAVVILGGVISGIVLFIKAKKKLPAVETQQ